jgi:hypothetical protein
MSHPSLMMLLFPYLFINGTGHYSMVNDPNMEMLDSNSQVINEQRGGVAAGRKYHTFGAYVKRQLLSIDRRFARDPSFLFWCFDYKEKMNIHSAKRHTVRSAGRDLTKEDIMDADGNYNYSNVTIVPHNITSSYAYKRKHYLDLKTMCEALGAPQLFLTFSCDDNAAFLKNGIGLRETWKDPVLFASLFQRKWKKFLKILKKEFAESVGGITDWCYVLEIQGKCGIWWNMEKILI